MMRNVKTLILALVLLSVTLSFGWVEQKKFAVVPNITGGVFHGSTRCTVDLGSYLYGAKFCRFTFRADTIVDTVSYYDIDLQFRSKAGGAWSSAVAIGADSITLNSEGATTTVTDTLAMGGINTFMQRYGSNVQSRMIFTPTVLAAKQGMKNCTTWVTKWVEN
jgi:hypothetical protein